MLPVFPTTVKLPAPISKSVPIYAFLVTARPPAVNTEATLLFAAVASAVLSNLDLPV